MVKSVLKVLSLLAISASFSAYSALIPVNLSTWIAEGGNSNWNVSGDNNSVLQTINGSSPTVFFEAGSNAQGQSLSGTIKVNTINDDDFIGFVLGYQSGELSSSGSEFWLIDWKKRNQSVYGGTALAGLSLSRVNGPLDRDSSWHHNNAITELARGTSLGSTGWVTGQEYSFDLVFTSTQIQVYVDGIKEIDFSGSFSEGAYGFYNNSQANVSYAGLTTQSADDFNPVPEPSALAIFAIVVLGLASRRLKK